VQADGRGLSSSAAKYRLEEIRLYYLEVQRSEILNITVRCTLLGLELPSATNIRVRCTLAIELKRASHGSRTRDLRITSASLYH
jgi:hypothetical protein